MHFNLVCNRLVYQQLHVTCNGTEDVATVHLCRGRILSNRDDIRKATDPAEVAEAADDTIDVVVSKQLAHVYIDIFDRRFEMEFDHVDYSDDDNRG